MKILILNWKDAAHPSAGGAEVFTHEVARAWVETGHDVTLFASAVEGRTSQETTDGIRVVRAGGQHGVYGAAKRFYRSQASGSFDLVIDEINTRPFLAPRFAADTAVVALAHQVAREVWFYERPLPVAIFGRYVAEPFWLSLYRNVPTMTLSASSRDSLRGYGLRDVRVIPVGQRAAPPAPRPPRAGVPTIVFTGRLARNKRPDHAVAAFRLAQQRVPDLRLRIIGTGPMEDELRAAAPPGVEFLGKVTEEEKYAALAEAHLLVVTSVREGWGLVVSEAAAVGTRTVAYNVPGLVDSVSACGGLLTEQTSPSQMAELIVSALPDALRSYGKPLPTGTRPWDEVAEAILAAAMADPSDTLATEAAP